MPTNQSLPRGCAGIRGSTDILRNLALGGQTAKKANRLYMLTVRRESLLSKRMSLENRLTDIKNQVSQIESELRQITTKYRGELPMNRKRKTTKGSNGHDLTTRSMSLKY